jgi:hypothetical protein
VRLLSSPRAPESYTEGDVLAPNPWVGTAMKIS